MGKLNKTLQLLMIFTMFISILCSYISKHYQSKLMSQAALGVAVLAPLPNSQDWKDKLKFKKKTGYYFNISIGSGVTALILNAVVIFL
ncbi:MAG: hypothetical protein KGI54_08170 [Pseudomonadota bacterium]|nr:hypothetical protein [Pseudomonadota bacterium]